MTQIRTRDNNQIKDRCESLHHRKTSSRISKRSRGREKLNRVLYIPGRDTSKSRDRYRGHRSTFRRESSAPFCYFYGKKDSICVKVEDAVAMEILDFVSLSIIRLFQCAHNEIAKHRDETTKMAHMMYTFSIRFCFFKKNCINNITEIKFDIHYIIINIYFDK